MYDYDLIRKKEKNLMKKYVLSILENKENKQATETIVFLIKNGDGLDFWKIMKAMIYECNSFVRFAPSLYEKTKECFAGELREFSALLLKNCPYEKPYEDDNGIIMIYLNYARLEGEDMMHEIREIYRLAGKKIDALIVYKMILDKLNESTSRYLTPGSDPSPGYSNGRMIDCGSPGRFVISYSSQYYKLYTLAKEILIKERDDAEEIILQAEKDALWKNPRAKGK